MMIDCIIWTGAVQSSGYGSVTDGKGGSMLAHRKAWEAVNGPIPEGMTIDHLCNVKICQNVDHMEVVTRSENSRRKIQRQTHCKRGHELSGDNVRENTRGSGLTYRICLACRRRANAAYMRARRERLSAERAA